MGNKIRLQIVHPSYFNGPGSLTKPYAKMYDIDFVFNQILKMANYLSGKAKISIESNKKLWNNGIFSTKQGFIKNIIAQTSWADNWQIVTGIKEYV